MIPGNSAGRGTGDGEASVSIANHLTCGVTVVTADKGEEKCHAYWRQQKLGNEAATLYCIASDVRELPFKNEDVDIVVDVNGLMHVFHADRAVAEISRILKPGGFVVASAFNVIPGSFRQKHGGISSIEQLVTLYEKNDISVITTECILKTDAGDPRATGLLFQKTGA